MLVMLLASLDQTRETLAELLSQAGWGPAGAAAGETRARPLS